MSPLSGLRLRQICLVSPSLDPVLDELRAVLGLEVGHVDPGVAIFGLENALLPVGHQFLEVVAPVKEGTAAGRYLSRRNGPGGYMVITQCGDHEARRKRVEALGVRVAFEIDRPEYRCMQLHPRDTGGALLEIDQQLDDDAVDGEWWPAGRDWRRAVRRGVVSAITAAELQSPEPERLAARWSDIVEIPVERDLEGQPQLALDDAVLRFVPERDGRGEGLGGIDLAARDREGAFAAAAALGLPRDGDAVLVCGTRVRLVEEA